MHDDNALSTTQYHDLRSNGESTEPPDMTPALSNHDPKSDSECTEKTQESKPPESSVPLKRTVYPVFLVLFYSAAAIYSWAIICILTYRPIGGVGYGIDQLNHVGKNLSEWQRFLKMHDPLEWEDPWKGNAFSKHLNEFYNKSEEYLRAARVVQALVSVATVPLTSAVCLQVAVVYTQQKRTSNGPTLRQSMALADKGWTDPILLGNLIFGGWRKYSSALLILSLFVHLLGEFKSSIGFQTSRS